MYPGPMYFCPIMCYYTGLHSCVRLPKHPHPTQHYALIQWGPPWGSPWGPRWAAAPSPCAPPRPAAPSRPAPPRAPSARTAGSRRADIRPCRRGWSTPRGVVGSLCDTSSALRVNTSKQHLVSQDRHRIQECNWQMTGTCALRSQHSMVQPRSTYSAIWRRS
jgi:hypothetical protein